MQNFLTRSGVEFPPLHPGLTAQQKQTAIALRRQGMSPSKITRALGLDPRKNDRRVIIYLNRCGIEFPPLQLGLTAQQKTAAIARRLAGESPSDIAQGLEIDDIKSLQNALNRSGITFPPVVKK